MKSAVIGTIMPWSGGLSAIPSGWIICDGSAKLGSEYPLLALAIGDTYRTATASDALAGSFPDYRNQGTPTRFVLPNLTDGRMLMDIESSYFPTANATEVTAKTLIEPYIGTNIDNGVPEIFTDVKTDVVFTINDRNGYSGQITGNQKIDGQFEKSIFLGGRKLGHTHIRSHQHGGSYDTVDVLSNQRPGLGVVPYDKIHLHTRYVSWDRTSGEQSQIDGVGMEMYWTGPDQTTTLYDSADWANFGNFSGFGSGTQGVVVTRMKGESPPINLSPQRVNHIPHANLDEWTQKALDSDETVTFGSQGRDLTVPGGYRNYYEESPNRYYHTLISNQVGADWQSQNFFAHGHDPFTVVYKQNSLKPQPRLEAVVNINSATNMDNQTNEGALQINMDTAQPSLTCIYIIRAY